MVFVSYIKLKLNYNIAGNHDFFLKLLVTLSEMELQNWNVRMTYYSNYYLLKSENELQRKSV